MKKRECKEKKGFCQHGAKKRKRGGRRQEPKQGRVPSIRELTQKKKKTKEGKGGEKRKEREYKTANGVFGGPKGGGENCTRGPEEGGKYKKSRIVGGEQSKE